MRRFIDFLYESQLSKSKENSTKEGVKAAWKKSGNNPDDIKTPAVKSNFYSDVHVKTDEDDFYIEVKLDDTAAVGKYTCSFQENRFVVSFDKMRKRFNGEDRKDKEGHTIDFDEALGSEELNNTINDIINGDVKNIFIEQMGTFKDLVNNSLIELENELTIKRNGTLKWRKGFYENLLDGEIKQTELQFPLFFSKLPKIYKIFDTYHKDRYDSIRSKALEYIKEEYKTADENDEKYKAYKTLQENIDKDFQSNDYDSLTHKLEYVDKIVNREFNTSMVNDDDLPMFVQCFKTIKYLFGYYQDILGRYCKKDRKLCDMTAFEMIKSTYMSLFGDKIVDALKKYTYASDNGDYFVVGSGTYNREDEQFKNLMNSVIRYYKNIDDVAYIQSGNNVYYLDKQNDPLGLLEKTVKEKNGIQDFKESFTKMRYSLYVVPVKGSSKESASLQMRLYILLDKDEQINSNVSFDSSDAGRDLPSIPQKN